ncbi:hypothetical protein AgCh_018169 [Apium graveolens]
MFPKESQVKAPQQALQVLDIIPKELPTTRVVSSREDSDIGNSRTRLLPRVRSFGNPRTMPLDIIKDRILQWRRSIYEQNLQATRVPCSNSKLQEQIGFSFRHLFVMLLLLL